MALLRSICFFSFLLFITQIVACAQTVQQGIVDAQSHQHGSCSSANLQTEMVNQINSLRASGASCGSRQFDAAPPLRWNAKLQIAADNHALDMAKHNFFNHKSTSNGSTMLQRLREVGYAYSLAGENIAAGQASVAQVINTWRQSPPHCTAMMKPEFTELGASCQMNTNAYFKSYWTLKLAAPAH